ncbi:hypothetical protein GIB67_003680, partial [Kingdonia uniflora]
PHFLSLHSKLTLSLYSPLTIPLSSLLLIQSSPSLSDSLPSFATIFTPILGELFSIPFLLISLDSA